MATSNERTSIINPSGNSGYTRGPVDNPKQLTVLWYFLPPGENKDPYSYNPGENEIDVVNTQKWAEGKYFWPKLMNDWICRYWRGVSEKTFSITFEEADKLIVAQKGIKDQVLALCVQNIEDLNKVNAEWFAVGKNDDEAEMNRKLPRKYKNLKKPTFFKLDPYFFNSNSHENLQKIPPNPYGDGIVKFVNENSFEGNLFKYYIKYKTGNEERGDHPYNKLHLVGRIIEKDDKECVVIIVGVKKGNWRWRTIYGLLKGILYFFRQLGVKAQIESEFDYQVMPPTTDGPDGPGGGGAMP